MFRLSLLALFISYHCLAKQALQEAFTKSSYDEDNDSFITNGRQYIKCSPKEARRILIDFTSYNEWALYHINGDKDGESDFLTLIKDMIYYSEDTSGFNILYDLDLTPPFGSKDLWIRFNFTEKEIRDDYLLYSLKFIGQNIALKEFILTLKLAPVNSDSISVDFHADVKFGYFLNLFMNMERYRANVEWRILKVINNLQGKLQITNFPKGLPTIQSQGGKAKL